MSAVARCVGEREQSAELEPAASRSSESQSRGLEFDSMVQPTLSQSSDLVRKDQLERQLD